MALSAVSFMLMSGIAIPTAAGAGVFSSLLATLKLDGVNEVSAGYHGGPVTSTTKLATPAYNLQTMPLPRAAMHIDPNPSKGGGDVTIVGGAALLPEEGPSGTLADIEAHTGESTQISVYVVREGDTLSQIAQMFNVTVNTIIWANDLDDATIQPGQTLAILPVTGIRYTVKNGGTLRDIIDTHGGDIEEAALFNGISPDEHLAAGTEVVIPDGEYAVPEPAQSTTPRSSSRVVRSASGPEYAGYYMKPVNGTRTQGLHGYNAVDLGAPIGTPIVASASGDVIIVKSSGWNGGYGNYLVIRHDNGTQTLYAHNSRNIVGAGQRVVQGQVIGYVGSTGRSTGPHVHFEVRGATNPF